MRISIHHRSTTLNIQQSMDNIHFIQFNNRKQPQFLELKNEEWITYGVDDDYGIYLDNLNDRCATHGAIIQNFVNLVCGNGWTYNKSSLNTLQQRAMAQKVIKQPIADVDLDYTTFKFVTDLKMKGHAALLVQWSKSKRTATLTNVSVNDLRSNIDNTVFYYTKNWWIKDKYGKLKKNKKPQEEKDFKIYKAYDPNNRDGNQIAYLKLPSNKDSVYGLPDYIQGITWIENDIKYSDFQYKNIAASFSPAKVINIYGKVPDPDQQRDIVDGMKRNFTGEEGERIVVNFAATKEQGIEATDTIVSDQSTLYKEIADQSEYHIFTTHGFPKILLGVTEAGALGQRNEAELAYHQYYNMRIKPVKKLVEKFFNTIVADLGVGVTLVLEYNSPFATFTLEDESVKNIVTVINSMPDVFVTKFVESLTADEIRSVGKLKGKPQTATATTLTKFESVKVDLFAQYGVDASAFEEVEARDIPTVDPLDLVKFESDFLMLKNDEVKVRSLDRTVLDLISKDKYITPDGIAKVAKMSVKDVQNALGRLQDKGMIDSSSEMIEGVKTTVNELTAEGAKTIEAQPAKTEQYQVMYKYALAENAPDLVSGGQSREFCARLMGLNKLYTREEINMMSDKEGHNVWTLRGGWYHNPNTGINMPQCRHTWKQIIVKQK